MLTATCHCGAVSIEVAGKPERLTECTCSVCRRYGARWAYYTRETATVHCAPGATTAYLWGDRELEFHHCTTCGCLTHYEAVDKSPGERIALNARLLAPEEIEGTEIRFFDGANLL